MKQHLIIVGAGGHGKVVADIAIKMNLWNSISFIDDKVDHETLLGIKIVNTLSNVSKYIKDHDFFVAIGDNKTRKSIQNKLLLDGASLPTLIHPKAVIGEDVIIGAGSVVMAGVIINPSTKIGQGCIVNTGATIDHDNIIEDFVHISPGAHLAGGIRIGSKTWIGIGSTIVNNITIESDCIVGAGSVVIKDIAKIGTYVGVPARRVGIG